MKIIQTVFLSIFLLIQTSLFSQNIFLAGQIENTIHHGPLELFNNAFYYLDDDLYFDLHVYYTIEPNGPYTTYHYFVEPLGNYDIAMDIYPPGDTIYPGDHIWSDSAIGFASEDWYNGISVFGYIQSGWYIYTRHMDALDTIFSWVKIGNIGDYFVSTASWCPCLTSISDKNAINEGLILIKQQYGSCFSIHTKDHLSITSLFIYSQTGKLVFSDDPGEDVALVRHLKPGIYFIALEAGEKYLTGKVIIR